MTELEKNLRAGLFWLTDEEKKIRDEKNRARDAAWFERTKEQRKLYYQQYSIDNREKITARRSRYYAENKNEIAQRASEWKKANPEKYRTSVKINSARRRALKANAEVNLESIREFVTLVKSKRFAICYYCERKISSKSIHMDHIIPLCKGGAHSVENLCVSCADCNRRKHDKTPQAWIKVGQQFLAL